MAPPNAIERDDMTSFAALKKNRAQNMEKLNKQLTDMGKNRFDDPDAEKFWRPTVDQDGNGSATIRFLPEPDGEDVPFIKRYSYGFKGPTGQWYIEKSRRTIGEADPVDEVSSRLFATGQESDKKKAMSMGYKTGFVSGIRVIKDPAKPENNGKVFLYEYGKKIFNKLNESMNPAFEDEAAVNPFDMWEGCNFKLKVKKVDGFPNYDSSKFDLPSPLADSDEEIEKIWKQCHSLQDLLKPEKYKSYDELKARYELVMGLAQSGGGSTTTAQRSVVDEEVEEEKPRRSVAAKALEEAEGTPRRKVTKEVEVEDSEEQNDVAAGSDDDDDDMAFYKSLVNS